MAMQMGLHLPVSGQEFSKVRLSLDTIEIEKRARTWGCCQLIHLRSGVPKGNPAPGVFEIPYDLDQRRIMFDNLSPTQKFELKLQDVINRCCIAVSQNGLRVMTSDQERSLDTLLALFSAQIASIGLDASSGKRACLNSSFSTYHSRARPLLRPACQFMRPISQPLQIPSFTGSNHVVPPLEYLLSGPRVFRGD